MEQFDKLDYVFENLKTQTTFLTQPQILNILKDPKFEISDYDLIRIMDRLVNDGNVIVLDRDEKAGAIPPKYQISFYGYLFKSYKHQFCINKLHKTATSIREWSLAFGTVLAGLYGLMEIFKYFKLFGLK